MKALAILSCLITLQGATPTPTIKVDGDGYLRFNRDGRAVYAKEAKLTVKEGRVANELGHFLMPTILAPSGATIDGDADGNLFAVQGEQKSRIGRLVLAVFSQDAFLSESNGVLIAVDRPQLRHPGENGAGKLASVTAKPTVKPATTESKPVANEAKPPANETKPSVKPTEEVKSNEAPAVKPETRKGPRVDVNAVTELESDKVAFGDIAKFHGIDPTIEAKLAKIDLGPTPMLGVERSFDKGFLQGRLRQVGVKPEEVNVEIPDKVVVIRKGQSITQQQFLDAVNQAIKETSGVSVEYGCSDTAPDYRAPLGRVTLIVEGLSGINTPTLTALVGIYVEGKRINSRTLKYQAKQNPQAVKAGQNVKVVMRAGTAAVEVQGVCRTTAAVGKPTTVEVRLDGGQKSTHQGSVIAEGIVEVRL